MIFLLIGCDAVIATKLARLLKEKKKKSIPTNFSDVGHKLDVSTLLCVI